MSVTLFQFAVQPHDTCSAYTLRFIANPGCECCLASRWRRVVCPCIGRSANGSWKRTTWPGREFTDFRVAFRLCARDCIRPTPVPRHFSPGRGRGRPTPSSLDFDNESIAPNSLAANCDDAELAVRMRVFDRIDKRLAYNRAYGNGLFRRDQSFGVAQK